VEKMTEQEKFDMQVKLAVHDEKSDAFLQEMRDFKEEMRDRDNQRHSEMAEIRRTTDARIEKIENKLDSIAKHVQILSLTAMSGIIAAGVGIAAMVWTVISR